MNRGEVFEAAPIASGSRTGRRSVSLTAAEGMIGMDESILRLYKAGRISRETALHFAMNPDQLQKKMRR